MARNRVNHLNTERRVIIMKESQKLILSLLTMFFFVQMIGLYLGWKLIQQPEIQPETSAIAGAGIFLYILVATAVLLALIKFVPQILKLIEVVSIFFSTEIFFEVLFLGFATPTIGFYTALVFAAAVVIARMLKKNYTTQNIAILLSIMGVGSLLGATLGVIPAMVLLGLLAVYDVIAVFKTKHMITLAKEVIKQKLAFTVAIPTSKRVYQLGGGDLVMPLIFTVAVLREYGPMEAVVTVTGAMLGLVALFALLIKKPGKAYPALPPVAIGSFIGLGIALTVRLVLGG